MFVISNESKDTHLITIGQRCGTAHTALAVTK